MKKAKITGVSALWTKIPQDGIYEVYTKDEVLAMDGLNEEMVAVLDELDDYRDTVGWVQMEENNKYKGLTFTQVFARDVEWL